MGEDLPIFEELTDLQESNIILDIDGTIIPEGEDSIPVETKNKVISLKKKNKIWICSNNHDRKRTERLAQELGVGIIGQDAQKPWKRVVRETLKTVNVKKEVVVIGDKFITDHIYAIRMKATFIRIKRKRNYNEMYIIRVQYFLDDILNRLIVRPILCLMKKRSKPFS